VLGVDKDAFCYNAAFAVPPALATKESIGNFSESHSCDSVRKFTVFDIQELPVAHNH